MADLLFNSLKMPAQCMTFKLYLNAKINVRLFIDFVDLESARSLESSYLIIIFKKIKLLYKEDI
jgi:hypothetical protein